MKETELSNDPFSDAPDDAPTPESTSPVAVLDRPAGDGNKVRVTLKGGSGFDAPWVTIDGTSVEDALDQLSKDETLKDLVDKTAKVGSYFARTGPAAPARGGGGGGSSASSQKSSPDGKTMSCDHGSRDYKTGVSKAGKTWMAFDCPEGVCDREWHNAKK